MSSRPYGEYKDSGVEWLGDVPDHWEVRRLGSMFIQAIDEGETDLPILSVSIHHGVSDREFDEEELDRKVTRSENRSKYRKVQSGDLVYNMMRAWQGGFGAVTVDGMVSPAYVVARPINEFSTQFVELLLRTPQAIEQMRRYSQGVTDFRLRLYWNEFKAIRIAIPPPDEQTAIASFLDVETSKINALVSEQRRLIELLKEKRQAVISHAVTKGLNPNAPMRPSGIQWLGDVPEHWSVGKCGFYLTILSGFAFPSAGFSDDESNPKLLRGINVGVSRLKWDETVYWQRFVDDGLVSYEMKAGDLVIGMDRPLIGEGMRVAKVKVRDLPCLLLQRVASLKTGNRLNGDYLLALISSEMFVAHFSPDTTGVSVPHISPEQINNFIIPVPPVLEQETIVALIEAERTKLDALIAEAE